MTFAIAAVLSAYPAATRYHVIACCIGFRHATGTSPSKRTPFARTAECTVPLVYTADMTGEPHFTPALFDFFGELALNNDREWFNENRERYLRDVRDPVLKFVADFAPRLSGISFFFNADPRPSGGSMFRIHRDVRFSKDKSPYKTNAGIQFRHEQARDAHAPGFYLHLEPGGSGAAAGMWKPGRDEMAKVRGAIAASPSKWRDSTSGGEFKRRWEVTGESLVRAPRGFDPEHPAIDEIKRKDFIAWSHFTDEEICSPNFIDEYTDACYGVSPMVEYLSETIGLSF